MHKHPTIQLAQSLIQRESISPDDKGCQEILITGLKQYDFHVTSLPFGNTQNFWATHGCGEPVIVFAGHTDVVSVGDPQQWSVPPFSAEIIGDRLYGRGSADMKGSLSAMIVAGSNFVKQYPQHKGTLAFLVTSDEEDSGEDGTKKVVAWLMEKGQKITYCLLGEPSSHQQLGDVVKNGRRGSLLANLRILGVQGHVAYPHLADNPIHRILPFLQALTSVHWDKGNDYFPPTCLQITNIHAGQGSTNVIPPYIDVQFNLRYSSEVTDSDLQDKVARLLAYHQLNYQIEWHLSGEPFFTPLGFFTEVVQDCVKQFTHLTPTFNTTGGTSDGRFIAKTGAEVLELGGINALIHKVDEWTSCQDLLTLEKIYFSILQRILKDK